MSTTWQQLPRPVQFFAVVAPAAVLIPAILHYLNAPPSIRFLGPGVVCILGVVVSGFLYRRDRGVPVSVWQAALWIVAGLTSTLVVKWLLDR